MNIKITNKYGATLKTANKYVEEDISITLDESFVQPFGTLEVTENGTHDVTNYESVNVNVASSGGGSENVLQKQINENTAMGLFSNWAYNISLDEYINSLDFSSTHNTSYMFSGCQNLKSTPSFNTSNVTNMSNMFSDCSNLTTISQLDTSKVVYMSKMFYYCSNLTSIPQLDTSSVINMNNMFYMCTKLTSIPQLNTSNLTNMSYMFRSCSKLTSVPQLDTSKVTNMSNMFYLCTGLTSIPQLDTSSVTNMNNTFNGCSALETIDITYYNISSTSNVTYFVRDCTALKALIIRSFGTSYTLSSNSLQNNGIAKGTGYIYVPRNMVSTLQSATNWSTYADQIRALEDYTVDGTTTGALDETKI